MTRPFRLLTSASAVLLPCPLVCCSGFGGNSRDGNFGLLLDSTQCDPAVCGSGSSGVFNGVVYSPASALPNPSLMLNALALTTATPAGATQVTSIGNGPQGDDSGAYAELVLWSSSAPSAADQSTLYTSQWSLSEQSQWCLGLSDATACLTQLLLLKAGTLIVVPFPNVSYSISSVLNMPVNTGFDCNGCTITLLNNPNHGWYDFLFCIGSNSLLRNVTFTSPQASFGICLYSYSNNLELDHVHLHHVLGTAINFGQNVTGVNIHDSSFVQVSYGVLMNAWFISDVNVTNCYFRNNSADAVAINSPVMSDQQYPWWSHVWVTTNVRITYNTMLDIRNDLDESVGFCVSSAGGQQVWVMHNYMSGCSWQAVHLEDMSSYIYVVNNTIDNVYGNAQVAWAGACDGVWMANSQQVLIANNTFSRIQSAAIAVVGEDRTCFLDEQNPYEFDGIFVPWFFQTSHDINITGNTFVSWGLDGAKQSMALQIGTFPGEADAYTRVWGNTYNASLIDKAIWCLCVNGVAGVVNVIVEDEQMVALGEWCSGYLYSEASCSVAITHCPGGG